MRRTSARFRMPVRSSERPATPDAPETVDLSMPAAETAGASILEICEPVSSFGAGLSASRIWQGTHAISGITYPADWFAEAAVFGATLSEPSRDVITVDKRLLGSVLLSTSRVCVCTSLFRSRSPDKFPAGFTSPVQKHPERSSNQRHTATMGDRAQAAGDMRIIAGKVSVQFHPFYPIILSRTKVHSPPVTTGLGQSSMSQMPVCPTGPEHLPFVIETLNHSSWCVATCCNYFVIILISGCAHVYLQCYCWHVVRLYGTVFVGQLADTGLCVYKPSRT